MNRAVPLACIGLYGLLALLLAVRGRRRATSLESFFVGSRELSPLLVGLCFAGQLAGVSTFLAQSGLVYRHGLYGLLGVALAAVLGSSAGVLLLSRGFRRLAESLGASSLPGWLRRRYRSRRLQLAFALLGLALTSLLALVLVGLAPLAGRLLGLPVWGAAALLVALVLLGVVLGGANSSLPLGALQALLMIAAAIVVASSGPRLGELALRLRAAEPGLLAVGHSPASLLRVVAGAFGANFLVGMALVCQPQVAARLLHLKSPTETGRFLAIAVGAGLLMALVILGGAHARLALGPGLPVEEALVRYVQQHLTGAAGLIASLGILSAGLITLEGLLLAISGILALDLLEPARLAHASSAVSLLPSSPRLGRIAVAAVGAAVLALVLAGLAFGSSWLRGTATHALHLLLAASFVPVAAGLLVRRELPDWLPGLAALLAVATYGAAALVAHDPVFLAAAGIVVSAAVMGVGLAVEQAWRRRLISAVESMCHPGPSRG